MGEIEILPADYGFHFMPNDEQMLKLLKHKIRESSLPAKAPIIEKNLYEQKLNPWDLFGDQGPWQESRSFDDKNQKKKSIYVFTKLEKLSERRYSRRAGQGTWVEQNQIKISKDKISEDEKREDIGIKRTFFFQLDQGIDPEINSPGHWIMYEYSLPEASLKGIREEDQYVICRIIRDDSKSLKRKPAKDRGANTANAVPEAKNSEYPDTDRVPELGKRDSLPNHQEQQEILKKRQRIRDSSVQVYAPQLTAATLDQVPPQSSESVNYVFSAGWLNMPHRDEPLQISNVSSMESECNTQRVADINDGVQANRPEHDDTVHHEADQNTGDLEWAESLIVSPPREQERPSSGNLTNDDPPVYKNSLR